MIVDIRASLGFTPMVLYVRFIFGRRAEPVFFCHKSILFIECPGIHIALQCI